MELLNVREKLLTRGALMQTGVTEEALGESHDSHRLVLLARVM